jgi:hypothetical protein
MRLLHAAYALSVARLRVDGCRYRQGVAQRRNPDDFLANERERQEVAAWLEYALAEGRFDLAEFERRVTLAYGATTHGELASLTVDLPKPPHRLVQPRTPPVSRTTPDPPPSPATEEESPVAFWGRLLFTLIGVLLVTGLCARHLRLSLAIFGAVGVVAVVSVLWWAFSDPYGRRGRPD